MIAINSTIFILSIAMANFLFHEATVNYPAADMLVE